MNFGDLLVWRLVVVKEPAQGSAAAQNRNVYSPWDSQHPNQSSTLLSENTWKLYRDLIFYFHCSMEEQMCNDGYFRINLVLFPPLLLQRAVFVVLFLSFLVLRWFILKILHKPWDGGMFLRLKQAAKASWNVFTQYLCTCTGMYDFLLVRFHMAKNYLSM